MIINRSSSVMYQSVMYFPIMWHLFRDDRGSLRELQGSRALLCSSVLGLWLRWAGEDPKPLCWVLALGMVLREEANSSFFHRARLSCEGPLAAPLGQGDEGESWRNSPTDTGAEQEEVNW